MMPGRALLCSAGSDAGGRTQCRQQGCGHEGHDPPITQPITLNLEPLTLLPSLVSVKMYSSI